MLLRRTNKSKVDSGDDEDVRVEAAAVVRLIRAAREAIDYHHADDACTERLVECVDAISSKFGLHTFDLSTPFLPCEPSLEAILRLLVYLKTEISESLADDACTKLLQECIEDLAGRHFLFDQKKFLYVSYTSN